MLVEPIAKFEPDIRNILSQYRGRWIQAAASDIGGLGQIFVEDHYEEMSSFGQRNNTQWPVRTVGVELVRLMDLVDAHQLEGPFVIKTDVEGFDLNVLKGAQRILTETPLIISECRLDEEFGSPTFSPMLNFLYANSFEICNILESRWSQDGSLRWVNVAFKNQRF
ncbi:hypothetical protein A6U97_27830 [Agrobacterium tumefaciens]|nr:hypothetical protein A6U97_27830 [Agrobacterium tumefaciens]